MAKVSAEQHIQAVQQYLNGNESMFEIAKDIGVTDRHISEWVRRYQKKGVETFLKNNTKNSADYKMYVLNYMNKTGTFSIDTAALFTGGDGVSTDNGENFKGTTALGTIQEGASHINIQPVEIAGLMSVKGHTEIELHPIIIELKK
ncbi:transposase [Lysinibacillus xylanilyticus]|uniref:transposase n=1 Tax=Lysinibacillus xylanilyticus TaxID=582475 RepID=UPI003D05E38C